MSITPRVQVPYPESGSSAIIESDLKNIATFIDSEVPIYYQSPSAPTFTSGTASSGATGGEFWWCTDTTNPMYGFNYWDGSNWYNVTTQMFMVGSTEPSPKFAGLVWYDTSLANGSFKYWSGTAWANIIPGTATNGLVLTSGSSGPVWTAITPVPSTSGATNGKVLTVVSGAAAWASLPTYSGATSSVQGLIQLAGDISGTATSPTVTSVAHVSTGVLNVANGGTGVTISTGTGSNVLSNSPTLVTPTLGVATATSINGTSIPLSATLLTSASTATGSSAGIVQLAGDLGGTATSPTVTNVSHVSTGTLAIANGGTGATTAGAALTALGAMSASVTSLPSVTSVNGTTIPSSSTLVTSATTSLPSVTSVNGTTIPSGSSLVTSVTAADSTITVGGTSTAPTVKVNSVSNAQVTYTVAGSQSGTISANTPNAANTIYVFTGAGTLSIPSGTFTAGQQITVVNNSSSTPNIASSYYTLINSGSQGNQSAVLRTNGSVATAIYLGSNTFVVTGDII